MLPTFSIPPIGPQQAKVWGSTQLLFAHHGVECHQIRFQAGYRSSKHRHMQKWNRFVVLSGNLSVVIFRSGDIREHTTISKGQVTDVPPGVWHQFEVLEDGEALEFYWVVLEANDIERLNSGGKIECEK